MFSVFSKTAAGKSLQSCPTLCDPRDGSPPGSTVPGILQARTGVGCHFLLQCMKVKGKSLSRVRLFATPWTSAHQAPLSMGFSRQEYWSEVPSGTSGKENPCQCRRLKRHRFDPWIRNIRWRRAWQTTPIFLPGESHGQRSLVGCSPWGREESDTTERLHFHFSLSCIGEGNGNPLQCSCLENPRDGGPWWAAIYGVAQSWT